MNALPSPRSITPKIPMGVTARHDAWWIEPLLNFLGFSAFVVYATWRAVFHETAGQPNYYWPLGAGPEGAVYLSPFYSPLLEPTWWKFSPALLILIFPLGFRLTCYYYRKMYYRAYFMDPPGCAVGDRGFHFGAGKYVGETRFPLILQNMHRWFLYAAIGVIAILWYDAAISMWHQGRFHFGFGSLALVINCVLLSAYTFGCHALRHLVGGNVDCWSCTKFGRTRHKLWSWVTRLNERHMEWAWLSLFSVALTDFYVYFLATRVDLYTPYF